MSISGYMSSGSSEQSLCRVSPTRTQEIRYELTISFTFSLIKVLPYCIKPVKTYIIVTMLIPWLLQNDKVCKCVNG